MKTTYAIITLGCCLALLSQPAFADSDGEMIFQEKCTVCHALDSKKMGPSLKDMNKDLSFLKMAITDGIDNASPFPMPAFGDTLKPAQVDALVTYISSQQ